ncbi:alpha/beta hydrolase [Aspergillus novofumigatus IBT 16806]|uniref:Alpha/beta-hydrolase n=1 Tax=Aspergillus novofumigatus (strain IBT 16806) TaxID=1392255 RepID=A0A2I1BSI0_ASPN1|nr:alpha/beta-hydrolase [Aspergillus novofumigatus IBT 16806]PKX88348.1 alpha/beta-hydrolase [Aspergillus novofumigatus IBT 16806]
MPSTLPRPPYDVELEPALAATPIPHTITRSQIPLLRGTKPSAGSAHINANFAHEEIPLTLPSGEIVLSVWRPRSAGMIMANRFAGIREILDYLQEHNAVCVSVEYRLAPEHEDPVPLEDCYAGLVWVAENAATLGIDPTACGGLAAGVCLLARDRGGLKISAQMLLAPMLDDRNDTKCLLGQRYGSDSISIYTSPSRAVDLFGLPMAYVDVGSAEIFRDEAVAYATRLWHCGVQAELHVWPGAFHAFDLLAPTAAILTARGEWIRRVISRLGGTS